MKQLLLVNPELENRKVAVFGTDRAALRLFSVLLQNDIYVECFVSKQMHPTKLKIMNKPVVSIYDFSKDNLSKDDLSKDGRSSDGLSNRQGKKDWRWCLRTRRRKGRQKSWSRTGLRCFLTGIWRLMTGIVSFCEVAVC